MNIMNIFIKVKITMAKKGIVKMQSLPYMYIQMYGEYFVIVLSKKKVH